MRRTQGWCYQFSYSTMSECPCRDRWDNKNLWTLKNITLKYVKENLTEIAGLLYKCTIIYCFNMVAIGTHRRIPSKVKWRHKNSSHHAYSTWPNWNLSKSHFHCKTHIPPRTTWNLLQKRAMWYFIKQGSANFRILKNM